MTQQVRVTYIGESTFMLVKYTRHAGKNVTKYLLAKLDFCASNFRTDTTNTYCLYPCMPVLFNVTVNS
jgi:hypothetical protein